MFGKFKQQIDLYKEAGKLLQDENVRALLAHPKFQELMRDPEFQRQAQGQDFSKLASHPKFASLSNDPELKQIFEKIRERRKA